MNISGKIASHVADIPKSGIRDFFEIVQTMDDVISLGVGEPDFGTAWRVREAAIYGLERGRTTYTANSGLLELRQAVAAHLRDRVRLALETDHVGVWPDGVPRPAWWGVSTDRYGTGSTS